MLVQRSLRLALTLFRMGLGFVYGLFRVCLWLVHFEFYLGLV